MKTRLSWSGNLATGLFITGLLGCTPPPLVPGADDGQVEDQHPAGPGQVAVNLQADFGAGGAASQAIPGNKRSTCLPGQTQDDPREAAGLDCDADGGPVAYTTPSVFKVAIKHLVFIDAQGREVEIIPDSGKLSAATVLDLTAPVELPQLVLPEGTYPSYRAELYYFEMRMPLNSPSTEQTLRLFLSDDDFPEEDSRGHHQGDITFIADDGTELGWVPPGEKWEGNSLLAVRPEGELGAGGTDPETGHVRGLFGDGELWNDPSNMQGPNQDILRLEGPLHLVIGDQARTVTFSFTAQDAWFFEDFDGDGVFGPCQNAAGPADGCAEVAAWAALFYPPRVRVE